MRAPLIALALALAFPAAASGEPMQVQAISKNARVLVLQLDRKTPGSVTVAWPAGVVGETRAMGGKARVRLPPEASLIASPPGWEPPPLAELRVELVGRKGSGVGTVDVSGDPAVSALRERVRAAHAEALAAHQAAYRAEHDLDALIDELATLHDRSLPLDAPLPTGRGDGDGDALADLSARCLEVRPGLERLQPRVREAEEGHRGLLPGVPAPVSGAKIRDRRDTLSWACERVTRAKEALAAREAAAEAAAAERARLLKSRRSARALKSVELVDEILLSAVGAELFVRWEDALQVWQDAETLALRLRRSGPGELEAAQAAAADAKRDAEAANAMIGLTLSGRSGQLADALNAAAKRLKALKAADREAILALYTPELAPSGRVLTQLLRDRL